MDALTQKDIDSLLRGAQPAVPVAAAPEAVRYDFLRPPRISKERRATLEGIYGRFAAGLQSFLSSRLRAPTDVTVASVEQATFAEFLLALINPCACFVVDLGDPAGFQGAIDLSSDFSFYLVDRLFGGPGEVRDMRRALTPLERSVVQSVAERILGILRDAWQDHFPLRLDVAGFEASPDALQVVGREASVLVANIDVRSGQYSGLLTICIPLQALEPFLQEKAHGAVVTRRPSAAAPAQRAQLETTVRSARLELSVRFPTIRLPARQVAGLVPGQVIRVGHPVDVPLEVHVNGRRRFLGALGQLRRHLGLKVTHVLPAAAPDEPARAPSGRVL